MDVSQEGQMLLALLFPHLAGLHSPWLQLAGYGSAPAYRYAGAPSQRAIRELMPGVS
jgi:hypothetical protein